MPVMLNSFGVFSMTKNVYRERRLIILVTQVASWLLYEPALTSTPRLPSILQSI